MIHYLTGDCRDVMRTLPAASVHCCVTSPPYWSLRDYGIEPSVWGGDRDCVHDFGEEVVRVGGGKLNEDGSRWAHEGVSPSGHAAAKTHLCVKCGAWRGCLGLEPTPEMFIANLVEVFREVRRVLRDDATCWVNLGLSYASGALPRIRFPENVPSCGTNGTELQDSSCLDSSCCDPCGERQGDSRSRPRHSARNDRQKQQSVPQREQTGRDSERLDSLQAFEQSPLVGDHRSTIASSSGYGQDEIGLAGKASAVQREQNSCASGEHPCEYTSACIFDTVRKSMPLVVRTSGKESFVSACGDTSCSGLGKCGKCWAYCTIPLLNLKAKDELNTPHLMAMALQADGWWLRQTIVWDKKNPMPESVNDRCTKAHEYIFLLSKSARYFYDAQAIAEEAITGFNGSSFTDGKTGDHQQGRAGQGDRDELSSRNKRSVWTIPVARYKGAHFATFPVKLVDPCIKAGTSEEGTCPTCGAPFERVYKKKLVKTRSGKKSKLHGVSGLRAENPHEDQRGLLVGNRDPERKIAVYKTVGWRPTCGCEQTEARGRCVVLDPFGGSGTVAEVAAKLGCDAILIDRNPDYVKQQKQRNQQGTLL